MIHPLTTKTVHPSWLQHSGFNPPTHFFSRCVRAIKKRLCWLLFVVEKRQYPSDFTLGGFRRTNNSALPNCFFFISIVNTVSLWSRNDGSRAFVIQALAHPRKIRCRNEYLWTWSWSRLCPRPQIKEREPGLGWVWVLAKPTPKTGCLVRRRMVYCQCGLVIDDP